VLALADGPALAAAASQGDLATLRRLLDAGVPVDDSSLAMSPG
jgi:hypothetical protein